MGIGRRLNCERRFLPGTGAVSNLWVMKSVPIRGSVGSVSISTPESAMTDPTLPRIGTDFMTHKLKLHQYPSPM